MEISSVDPRKEEAFGRMARILTSDTPKRFALIGNQALLSMPSIGFCGSRKASSIGLEAARECATEAAASGLVVVSGYAAGVDEEAHRAALSVGGATIIVLSEGLSRFRIRKFLKDVWDWKRVLVLSQWDDLSVWRSYQAMARNKTIIGLSNAMVVIEAGPNGGTQHAGESSLKLRIPLFVLEYRNMTEDRAGNAMLIQAGGIPIRRNRETGKPSLDTLFNAAYNNFKSEYYQPNLKF